MKKLFSIWIILLLGLGMSLAFAENHEAVPEPTPDPEPEPTPDPEPEPTPDPEPEPPIDDTTPPGDDSGTYDDGSTRNENLEEGDDNYLADGESWCGPTNCGSGEYCGSPDTGVCCSNGDWYCNEEDTCKDPSEPCGGVGGDYDNDYPDQPFPPFPDDENLPPGCWRDYGPADEPIIKCEDDDDHRGPYDPNQPTPPGCKRIIGDDGRDHIVCEEEERTRYVPQGCTEFVDDRGYTQIDCGNRGPRECRNPTEQDKRKCEDNGGRIEFHQDRGCNIFECRFDDHDQRRGGFLQGQQCPSKESQREIFNKCEANDLKPVITEDRGCKIVKCESDEFTGQVGGRFERLSGDERAQCEQDGGKVVWYYNEDGGYQACNVDQDCRPSSNEHVYNKCEDEGGKLVVREDADGCVVDLKCVRRGEKNIHYDKVDRVPPSSDLLSVAVKLDKVKDKFDNAADKMQAISDYYVDQGEDFDAERYSKASALFSSAADDVSDLKSLLRDRIGDLTVDDIEDAKFRIREIIETRMNDVIFILLSDEDTLEEEFESFSNDGSGCGADERCFDEHIRFCEATTFSPERGVELEIIGLENDACVFKVEADGPPSSDGEDRASMTCEFKEYARGMRGPEDFIDDCEGDLVRYIKDDIDSGRFDDDRDHDDRDLGPGERCMAECMIDSGLTPGRDCGPGTPDGPECDECADQCFGRDFRDDRRSSNRGSDDFERGGADFADDFDDNNFDEDFEDFNDFEDSSTGFAVGNAVVQVGKQLFGGN